MFIYAKRIDPIYTSRATVFPLNATPDNSGATSALTSMLGLSETPKSFSQDASINIVEAATQEKLWLCSVYLIMGTGGSPNC